MNGGTGNSNALFKCRPLNGAPLRLCAGSATRLFSSRTASEPSPTSGA